MARRRELKSGPSDPPETCHKFFKGKRVRLVVLQNLQQNIKTAGLGAPWKMCWCVGHRKQPPPGGQVFLEVLDVEFPPK